MIDIFHARTIYQLSMLMNYRIIRCLALAIVFSVPAMTASIAENAAGPFRTDTPFLPANEIDRLLIVELELKGLQPASLCSDEVFLRRIYLDLIGALPRPPEVRQFLKSNRLDKRAELIGKLMERDEFADYWTLKWCDILRVKAEFPINLWPNGVQAYARWIHDAVDSNMPYDRFARALLTSSGSNFRVPAVNFYRAVQGDKPSILAAAAALTFMGVRLDTWTTDQQKYLETFFSRVAFKGTAEWKEVIVYLDPAQTTPLKITFPDGTTMTIPGTADPREVFATWLLRPDNKWFAKNIANRAWSWLLGYGFIHEPDDIRPDNPAVHPRILAFLEEELVENQYDLRHLFRIILNSSTYQQCSIPRIPHPDAERLFALYPVRRLDAEVLIDALCGISGQREEYSSAIPEPFTFVPKQNRNIALTDGSITSPFLKMFGRPARDTGLESERTRTPTKEQRLHLLNSRQIHDKINKSWHLLPMIQKSKGNTDRIVEHMYVAVLSRFPTPEEQTIAEDHLNRKRGKRAATDLLWALLNSKEFLYRH